MLSSKHIHYLEPTSPRSCRTLLRGIARANEMADAGRNLTPEHRKDEEDVMELLDSLLAGTEP